MVDVAPSCLFASIFCDDNLSLLALHNRELLVCQPIAAVNDPVNDQAWSARRSTCFIVLAMSQE